MNGTLHRANELKLYMVGEKNKHSSNPSSKKYIYKPKLPKRTILIWIFFRFFGWFRYKIDAPICYISLAEQGQAMWSSHMAELYGYARWFCDGTRDMEPGGTRNMGPRGWIFGLVHQTQRFLFPS